MALSLITDIPATCYTSQLQKIELASSGTVVKFRIYYQAQLYYSGNGQTLIFSSSYNTRFSRVAIYDIGSLLETYLSDKDGLQQFIFYFSNGTDSLEQTYGIIYCKQLPLRTAADLANSNYITNYFNRLVYKGAKDQLPYFAGFGSPGGYAVRTITYTVVYRKTDGTFGTYDIISGGRTGFGISYVLTSSCFAMPMAAASTSPFLQPKPRRPRPRAAQPFVVTRSPNMTSRIRAPSRNKHRCCNVQKHAVSWSF